MQQDCESAQSAVVNNGASAFAGILALLAVRFCHASSVICQTHL